MFEAYKALLTGMLFDPEKLSTEGLIGALKPLSETITMATPLILAGLSVALAFRAGLFNIGAEGQIILGVDLRRLHRFRLRPARCSSTCWLAVVGHSWEARSGAASPVS